MPIRQALGTKHAFSPEEITVLNEVLTSACTKLGITERDGSGAHAVAKALIEAAQQGERDPAKLCDHAVRHSGLPSK